jgi:hypothetical protein
MANRDSKQKWSSQKASLDHKRAVKARWQEEFRQAEAERLEELEQTKRRVEEIAASKARGEKQARVPIDWWSWGFKSENHSIGVIPYFIISLIAVPILGFLYKLSFTLFVPLAILAMALIALIIKIFKR